MLCCVAPHHNKKIINFLNSMQIYDIYKAGYDTLLGILYNFIRFINLRSVHLSIF